MHNSPAQKETRHAETMLPDSAGSGQAATRRSSGIGVHGAGSGRGPGGLGAGHGHRWDMPTCWEAGCPPKHPACSAEVSAARGGLCPQPPALWDMLVLGWLGMENFQKDSVGLHAGRKPSFKTLNV